MDSFLWDVVFRCPCDGVADLFTRDVLLASVTACVDLYCCVVFVCLTEFNSVFGYPRVKSLME